MKSPTDLIRTDIASMKTYQPIYPFDVVAARLGRAPEEIVKLDANENPYGPSPQVRDALAERPSVHVYPDPESRALRAALARYAGVPAELLLAGAGSDELIDLIMRLFLQPGEAILTCSPTFGVYAFDAAISGAQTIDVPRGDAFELDLDAIEAAALRHRPKLLFLTTPNNPDGGWLPDKDLERMLELPLVIVLDEAYIEFAGLDRSRIRWVARRENLIVLRSFSKWAGLAGLRAGYGAFPPAIAAELWKIKQPYNVSVAASAAALASLADQEHRMETVARIVAERERLMVALEEIPYLQPYRSEANYLLCRVLGRDALQLKMALEGEGILVRYFDTARLRDHIRISVGRPDQTAALMDALRRL